MNGVGELAYARRLLEHLDPSMLPLADAYCDAFDFLQAVQDTGARCVLRSTRKRCPTVRRPPHDEWQVFDRRSMRGKTRSLDRPHQLADRRCSVAVYRS